MHYLKDGFTPCALPDTHKGKHKSRGQSPYRRRYYQTHGEAERARARRQYENLSGVKYNEKLLKNRRRDALRRIAEREKRNREDQ